MSKIDLIIYLFYYKYAKEIVVPKRRLGDIIIIGRLNNGFDKRHPDFAFFKPEDGGDNIYVHFRNVDPKLLSQVCDDRDLPVEIQLIEWRGKVQGKIMRRYIPARPKTQVINPMSALLPKETNDKRAEKLQRQAALLARATVTVQTAAGRLYYGIPVTQAEWASVPDGTSVILVGYYDTTTGHVTDPLESFVVQKPGGKPTKHNRQVGVSFPPVAEPSAPKQSEPMKPIGTGLFKTNEGVVSAPIFVLQSSADVSRLVGVLSKTSDGRVAFKKGNAYQLGSVTEQGKLAPIAASLIQVVAAA